MGVFVNGRIEKAVKNFMITLFIPALADENNTNAQMLAIKHIVSHLDKQKFHITLFCRDKIDERISSQQNVTILPWTTHFNTLKAIRQLIKHPPDIYFYPQKGYLDYAFLKFKSTFLRKTKIITHVVHEINHSHLTATTFSSKIFRLILSPLLLRAIIVLLAVH